MFSFLFFGARVVQHCLHHWPQARDLWSKNKHDTKQGKLINMKTAFRRCVQWCHLVATFKIWWTYPLLSPSPTQVNILLHTNHAVRRVGLSPSGFLRNVPVQDFSDYLWRYIFYRYSKIVFKNTFYTLTLKMRDLKNWLKILCIWLCCLALQLIQFQN